MLTDDHLHAIMPALSKAKRDTFLPFLNQALDEFSIDSAPRHAAFLAQLAHESGQFRFMEELWGPTPAQLRYEPTTTLATSLGNTNAGDGKRFKGRGPIQITGRANYRRFGDLLHVDLVSNPALAALPDLAFRIAGLFWMKNGLNELADQASAAAFKQITRRINGGFNGLADRERFYAVACRTLGVTVAATGGAASRGRSAPSAPAETFQRGAEAIRSGSAAKRKRASSGTRPVAKKRAKQTKRAKPTRRAKPKRASGVAARRGRRRSATKTRT